VTGAFNFSPKLLMRLLGRATPFLTAQVLGAIFIGRALGLVRMPVYQMALTAIRLLRAGQKRGSFENDCVMGRGISGVK
jgi:hypothetical protein